MPLLGPSCPSSRVLVSVVCPQTKLASKELKARTEDVYCQTELPGADANTQCNLTKAPRLALLELKPEARLEQLYNFMTSL